MSRILGLLFVCGMGMGGLALGEGEGEGDGLAEYRLGMDIQGMAIEGMPPGVGDREWVFTLKIPADSPEAANAIWYAKMRLLLGDNNLRAMQEMAEQMNRR